MIYAPIMIITLNRSRHLKECIESLQRNGWAKYTELYISVDFPPSEKYMKGYLEIKKYLNKKIEGFKKVNVIFQKKNLGPYENARFLEALIYKTHDRIIILEDDNYLAPAFIEYCDRALEKYEENDKVLGICGSNYVWCGAGFKAKGKREVGANENNVYLSNLVWHGTAIWEKKHRLIYDYCSNEKCYKDSINISKMVKLYKTSNSFFYSYLDRVIFSNQCKLPWNNGKLYPIDFIWDIYMLINEKYVLCPVNSLVKDNGMDGSGVNFDFKADNNEEIQNNYLEEAETYEISQAEELRIDTKELEYHDRYGNYAKRTKIKLIIKYILYYLKNLFLNNTNG